jgi:hypothetical protein
MGVVEELDDPTAAHFSLGLSILETVSQVRPAPRACCACTAAAAPQSAAPRQRSAGPPQTIDPKSTLPACALRSSAAS